jgi:hypothetical protein
MVFVFTVFTKPDLGCCRGGREGGVTMDDRTAGLVADLYESKLFDATTIGERYGITRQRVVAVANRIWHERLISRSILYENPVDPL